MSLPKPVRLARAFVEDSPRVTIVMMEEFLAGEEATVTVMPPSSQKPSYWALPAVARFNHEQEIAPYNGVMAVMRNSRAISQYEFKGDASYGTVSRQCEQVAPLLNVTEPINIDV